MQIFGVVVSENYSQPVPSATYWTIFLLKILILFVGANPVRLLAGPTSTNIRKIPSGYTSITDYLFQPNSKMPILSILSSIRTTETSIFLQYIFHHLRNPFQNF